MEYPSTEARKVYEYNEARRAAAELQQAKIKALQDTLGNYGDFRYVDFDDFIDPDNQNWQDYTYRLPGDLFEKHEGRVGAESPVGVFINHIRDAETADDIKKQLELWNSYKPLELPHNGESYVNYLTYGLSNAPYGGSRPVFPTTDESNPVQTTAGGTQGAVAGGGTPSTQGVQAGGTGTGTGTQGMKAGGTGDTYASAGVPRGGTKTIGYDPNPGNISLAYAMRNAPEQERRTALIDKWNREHGISYVTGKDGVIYRKDPQHPNGYADPFKNDLSTWTRATYATPGISTGGTYATGEGIKDANGNVLTNPGEIGNINMLLRIHNMD